MSKSATTSPEINFSAPPSSLLKQSKRIRIIRRPRLNDIPMLHNTRAIKPQNIRNRLGLATIPWPIHSIMKISRVVRKPIVHDGVIDGGPERGQEIDGVLAAREGERVVLNVAWVDVRGEGEADVLLDPEELDEFLPDGGLVGFVGGFWGAV